MKQNMQRKLARKFNANVDLNRKVLGMKRSWDDVAALLKIEKTSKKK